MSAMMFHKKKNEWAFRLVNGSKSFVKRLEAEGGQPQPFHQRYSTDKAEKIVDQDDAGCLAATIQENAVVGRTAVSLQGRTGLVCTASRRIACF